MQLDQLNAQREQLERVAEGALESAERTSSGYCAKAMHHRPDLAATAGQRAAKRGLSTIGLSRMKPPGKPGGFFLAFSSATAPVHPSRGPVRPASSDTSVAHQLLHDADRMGVLPLAFSTG
jgi:hypothetical protein